jgi:LacI family transcriptional regulator
MGVLRNPLPVRDEKERMKQIALIYPYSVHWMGDFFLGVVNYAKEHGDWTFLTSPPTLSGTGEHALTLHNLQGWPGDGIITAITNQSQVKVAKKLRIPLVNLSGALRHQQFPTVAVDHYAIGRIAADHLLNCGFRRLAYYGIKKLYYSQQRRQGFEDRAAENGVPVDVFNELRPLTPRTTWQQRISGLVPWLRTLQPPIGLFAVHDYRARLVIDECKHLGLEVPHDVAVLGVDNDPTVCECCRPTLSSISRNGSHQGYEAARLLDQLMADKSVGNTSILIPPVGVERRRSTDTITVENPHVTTVIRHMYEHLSESFGIKRLVRLVSVSRRNLEKQFRRHLHCTPYEYLNWLRVEKAKQLLQGKKKFKIKEIATLCGFPHPTQFRIVFKRLTGQSPRQYATLPGEKEEHSPESTVEEKGAPLLPLFPGARSRSRKGHHPSRRNSASSSETAKDTIRGTRRS